MGMKLDTPLEPRRLQRQHAFLRPRRPYSPFPQCDRPADQGIANDPPDPIDAALGMPAAKITALLSREQLREGDVNRPVFAGGW